MPKIETLVSGFGLEPPLALSAETLTPSNPWTLKIRAHAVDDASGRRVAFFEKQVAHRPKLSGGSPETLFYRHVLPHWTAMQPHVCALLDADQAVFSTTLYLAAAPAEKRPSQDLFKAALALLPGMHRSGCDLLGSGSLDEALKRRLDFYRPSVERGRHLERLGRALENPLCAELVEPRRAALSQTLDRLAAAARAAPRAICHLDLLANNIFIGADGPVLIDWGEIAIAPFGFDYGSLMAACVRSLRRKEALRTLDEIWARLQEAAATVPDRSATLDAARYYFLFGLVRHLSAMRHPSSSQTRMILVAGLMDDVCGLRRVSRFG